MYTFEYLLKTGRISPELVSKVEALAEFKGKQDVYVRMTPDVLTVLRETTLSQSTIASNAIEGVEIPPDRLGALLARRAYPRDRSEEEIAGYRDLLKQIDERDDPSDLAVNPKTILKMHAALYKYTTDPNAGRWKSKDNVIEIRAGKQSLGVAFHPPAAAVTPRFMEELCRLLAQAKERRSVPALMIVAAFGLDFLCIHPFDDGNGRMARLLIHLLLLQEGYRVGRYVPLERLVFETKDAYYAALRASSQGWKDAQHDLDPWARYLLDLLIRAYRELDARVVAASKAGSPRAALIRDAAVSRGRFDLQEIQAAFPSTSRVYIHKILRELIAEGRLKRVDRGAYTATHIA